MDIDMIDVTLRLKDPIDQDQADRLQASLHELDGVISTHIGEETRHMLLTEINPRVIDADKVLAHVNNQGVSAELAVPDRF
ncbi:hypothetical protein HUS23_02000 [Ectothiorhodospiraceae bacterium 2226]|nr:hypothetical protein HUS23_02000 [Ectothiorhodospiraceae bacterium 2226]